MVISIGKISITMILPWYYHGNIHGIHQ
jgi:hypothetical protein